MRSWGQQKTGMLSLGAVRANKMSGVNRVCHCSAALDTGRVCTKDDIQCIFKTGKPYLYSMYMCKGNDSIVCTRPTALTITQNTLDSSGTRPPFGTSSLATSTPVALIAQVAAPFCLQVQLPEWQQTYRIPRGIQPWTPVVWLNQTTN